MSMIVDIKSQPIKMVPVKDQSSVVISLEVDLFIHSAYDVRKFLMQVSRDQVRTIGELEKKIQFDLGIVMNIDLFNANEFYMFPDLELSKFEDLGMSNLISVRPAPVKWDAGHAWLCTQHNVAPATPTVDIMMEAEEGENKGRRNSEADGDIGDSGMSDIGEDYDSISMKHTSSEQVAQIGNQNVEKAAEKRKDSEDSVLRLEQAGSSASAMPISSCESTFSVASSISLDSSILYRIIASIDDTATMSPRRLTVNQNVETAAGKRKDSEDCEGLISHEKVDSLASTMPLDSTGERTSPFTVEAASIPLDLSIQPNETTMMPPPRQSPRFGPLPPPLRKKVSFSPYSFTSPKQKNTKKKYPNTPKTPRRQSLPVILDGDSKVKPTLTISRPRHGALENLTNTSDGTQVMPDNLKLTGKNRSSLKIGEEVNVGKGTRIGYKTEPEKDSAVPPKSV